MNNHEHIRSNTKPEFVWAVIILGGREHMAVCQNLVPLVNIKIAGKWMFITKNGINRYWSIPIYVHIYADISDP